MLKQVLIFVTSSWAKVLLTVLSGFLGMALLVFLPQEIFMGIIGISVAVVFYDSVLKMIERVLKGAEQ